MTRERVERRETGFYIAGSRVPIDRIIWEYCNGEDPQTIRSHYATLSLEQVNGAIAFYLGHRDVIDAYLKQSEAQFDELCRRAREAHPLLYQKLDGARQRMTVRP